MFVEIPQLHPVMQLHLYVQLKSVDEETNERRDFAPDLYYTVYKMNGTFDAFPGYEKIAKRRFPDFPVIRKYPRDRRLVAQEERGRTGAGDLVSRKINAVPGLRFEPSQIRVPPGRRVALTFTNADISMQHNLVVVRKGTWSPLARHR